MITNDAANIPDDKFHRDVLLVLGNLTKMADWGADSLDQNNVNEADLKKALEVAFAAGLHLAMVLKEGR